MKTRFKIWKVALLMFGVLTVNSSAAVDQVFVGNEKVIQNFPFSDNRALSVSRGGIVADGDVLSDGVGVSVIGPSTKSGTDHSAYNKLLLKHATKLKAGASINELETLGTISAQEIADVNKAACESPKISCLPGMVVGIDGQTCEAAPSCDTGFTFNGSSCTKGGTSTVAAQATLYYWCAPSDGKSFRLSGTRCEYIYAQPFFCLAGSVQIEQRATSVLCAIYKARSSGYKYSCPSGVLSGTSCIVDTTVSVTPTCENGSLNLAQGMCKTLAKKNCN